MMKNLVLILVLVVGLFGVDETGKPYISILTGQIDSTVISPDGESFYTLKAGLVTQWQLNPIKKLTSFKIGIENTGIDKGYQISITNDNKNIIIYSRDKIQLFDIKNKKHLKTVNIKSWLGLNTKYGFLTLSKNNELKIWDDNNFRLLKKIKINNMYAYGEYKLVYGTKAENILVGDNILLISYLNKEIFFNLDTFLVADNFLYGDNPTNYYDKYKEKFTDELQFFLKRIPQGQSNSLYIYPNGKTLVLRTGGLKTVFVKFERDEKKDKHRIIINFRQYDNGWLLYRNKAKMYMGSKNIQKYLEMKRQDGKIVPMNDVTFKKYNTEIFLKD